MINLKKQHKFPMFFTIEVNNSVEIYFNAYFKQFYVILGVQNIFTG